MSASSPPTNVDLPALARDGQIPQRPAGPPRLRRRDAAAVARAARGHPAAGRAFRPRHERGPWAAPISRDSRRAAMARCCAHAWPGNVRELKNAVERSLYRWPDPRAAARRDHARSVRLAVAAGAPTPTLPLGAREQKTRLPPEGEGRVRGISSTRVSAYRSTTLLRDALAAQQQQPAPHGRRRWG